MMMDELFTQKDVAGLRSLSQGLVIAADDEATSAVLRQIPQQKGGTITKIKAVIGGEGLGEEGFLINGTEEDITLTAKSKRGWLYGAHALLHHSQTHGGQVPVGTLKAVPNSPFRSLKVYLPAPDDLQSFYRTVDMMCHYRLNTIIIEVGGAMEYARHPEINQAWLTYCEDMGRYPDRANEVQNMFAWDKNSIHFENGGGQFLSQKTVKKLIDYCRQRHISVIPEVPSLSHADYLLNPHPHLAERKDDPYPDVYCPSNPESYALLFDVLDEVIEVFEPEMIHIGHDEYYSIALCDKCKGKTGEEIFAGDVNKIYQYLAPKGIKVMLWAEKLLNAIDRRGNRYGGSEVRIRHEDGTVTIRRPATYKAIDLIPKDIWAMHWYWGIGEGFDDEFLTRGMPMVYGNFNALGFLDWNRRHKAGALGGGPSHWSSLEEDTLQRNHVLASMLYATYLFWAPDYKEDGFKTLLQKIFEELYWFKNRPIIEKPHIEITHTTTINRPYVYISSLPMQLEKDTIGQYVIEFDKGGLMNIPIIYGKNISNQNRSWERTLSSALQSATDGLDGADSYVYDKLLVEVSYTTLPLEQKEGAVFTCVFENPYPNQSIKSVRIEKTCEDEGAIYLQNLKVRE